MIEDVIGDGFDAGPATYVQFVVEDCMSFLPAAAPACQDASSAIPPTPAANGEPLAALDLVSIEIIEHPTKLSFSIAVGGLEPDMPRAVDDEPVRNRVSYWGVCWNAGTECALMKTARNAGVLNLFALYVGPPGCENVLRFSCGIAIPWEIEYGTPATIRLEVPRDILVNGTLGAELVDPFGVVFRGERIGEYFGRGLWGPTGILSYGTTGRRHFFIADVTEIGPTGRLSLPMVAFPQDDVSHTRALWPGDVTRSDVWGDRPDLDILEQRFVERPDSVTIAVKLAETSPQPDDHLMLVFLRTRGYLEAVAGFSSTDGEMAGWAIAYPDPDSDDFEVVASKWERTLGTPGWLNVTLERRDLGNPLAGDLVDKLLVQTRAHPMEVNEPLGPGHIWLALGYADDYNFMFPAYRWRLDPGGLAAG